jgi:apolipoprotein D and lipocalin family protein
VFKAVQGQKLESVVMVFLSRAARWAGLSMVLTLAGAPSALAVAQTAVATKSIDPQRYLGRWYEVGRIPNSFQKNCEAATSDWAKQGDDQYAVVQTCHTGSPSGPPRIWKGNGKVMDAVKAQIRISFFGGFIKQDYVVVDRAEDYSWCILATATPKFFWIMSRRPVISAQQKAQLVARSRQLGFDVTPLVYDQQPPG